MLRLTSRQVELLGALPRAAFIERVAGHLRRFFPDRCRALGPDGLRETVEYGVERARFHGFESERDVCKYLSLVCLFGRDFDRSPEHPWAARALARDGTAASRMGALYRAGLRRAEGVM